MRCNAIRSFLAGGACALALLVAACSAPPGSARTVVPIGTGTLEIRRGIVPVDGGTLVYEEAGRGAAVVLLHGGQLDGRIWDGQFAVFSRDYRTIRYDARGFGHSSPPAGPFAHAADLLALLDHLDVSRAHLVGLSLGGRIAVDFALEHPDRVASLTLAGPGLSGWAWTDDETAEPLREAVASGDRERVVEAWLASPYMAPAMENPELAPRLRELARDNAGNFLLPEREVAISPPAVDRLPQLHAPTLLIIGSRDVLDIYAIVERIASQVPGARVATFDGCGHMVNMERPEAFNHEVLAFLAEVRSRAE